MMEFFGRHKELKRLNTLEAPALVTIQGRRRIGKSRLVVEFAKNKRFFSFTGVPPIEGVTAQTQRDTFARQLAQNLKIPPITFTDWTDAFTYLEMHLADLPTIVLFDEISWMGSKDPTFIPKLKAWWDLFLQKSCRTILILCGSVSTWIEDNILKSTAFFGRISLEMTLDELSLSESVQMLQARGVKGCVDDMYKILSIVGGVPWYLEAFSHHDLPDEAIKHLCFTKNGKFTIEFDRIFHDIFNGHGALYKKILHILSEGMHDLATIRDKLGYPHSGTLSDYMHALIVSGFVSQHPQWSLQTGHLGKQSLYRLRDNYMRFFMKYIEPNLTKIEQGSFEDIAINKLPGWDSMMGFQIENLLLRNRPLLFKALDIDPANVIADNPYVQRQTVRQRGCQIDYLIHTHTHNLFVCEFKFRKQELRTAIIDEVQEKINRLSKPRHLGVIPVLFHLGGVSDKVYDQRYFYRIVDIGDFLS